MEGIANAPASNAELYLKELFKKYRVTERENIAEFIIPPSDTYLARVSGTELNEYSLAGVGIAPYPCAHAGMQCPSS